MRVTKHWNRLPRDSPYMEIFMISLQVDWTWFLKDPFQLKVLYDSVIMDLPVLGSYLTQCGETGLLLLIPLPLPALSPCLARSFLFLMEQLPLLLPDIVGPESFIVHPDRMQLLQHFPPNPCEWGWQIPKFSSSEGSSLIMLFSSMKSRGRKSETLSFEKLCKDQRKNYLWLAQAFLDFCLLACISGWSVSDFSKLNLEVFVRVFCKPKT